MSSYAATSAAVATTAPSRLGVAWLLMCFALAIHVTDEALTGFLSVYNPTVIALRQSLGYWPMPPFEFRAWLTSLTIGIAFLFLLSPFAFANARWMRPLAYVVAIVIGIGNGLGHTLFTVLGRTVASVHFSRPAPGFYSSPLLLACGIYLVSQLRRTAPT
jgi:hypothetical protein